jgi:hypothetical protein
MVGCLLLSVAPSFVSGSLPPPKLGDETVTISPTVSRDLVRELHLGNYVALFEKTSLREIRDKVGAGSLEHVGDAADALEWLCYSLPGQRVWLVSTEMGGSNAALMNVIADAISPSAPLEPSCPTIPSTLRPLSLPFGWIGSPVSVLRDSLGKPSGTRGDWLIYYFAGKESGPYQDPGDAVPAMVDYDVSAYVEVRVQKGKVIALRASHLTSY